MVSAPAAAAEGPSSARLLLLPPGTTVEEMAEAGFSPGLMSPGLGTVPPEQTYLDIGQGNRVFDSLYDEDLPPRSAPDWWRSVVKRAESAPAEIVPGLLEATLRKEGVPARSFEVRPARLPEVAPGQDQLLIAIARPTGRSDDPLPIGIAGAGFHGNLTSDSTQMDGYVLSTDLAPTILDHFGIPIPPEMSGQPIRTEGDVDVAAIESLGARMGVISSRRGPVIGLNVVIWLLGLALVALLSRGRLARPAVRLVGLSIVYMPLVLLIGAGLEPSEGAERLLVLLLSPALSAATLIALRGYRALALASAATVLAYAVDMVAGSRLTSLSLLGPNPGLGVRFYGIGNELEATVAALVPIGTGAALAGWAPRASGRAAAVAFAITAVLAVAAFAPGSFGADVGAAIGIPIGAAVSIGICLGVGRTGWVWVIVAPLAAVAALMAIDLATGGNAHLTRSVLDAGGLGNLGDIFQRRLQLSAHSFARYAESFIFWIVIALIVAGLTQWRRIEGWFGGRRTAWAGFVGALAATLAGTLANDSGALLLMIGAVLCAATVGVAWATHEERRSPTFWSPPVR